MFWFWFLGVEYKKHLYDAHFLAMLDCKNLRDIWCKKWAADTWMLEMWYVLGLEIYLSSLFTENIVSLEYLLYSSPRRFHINDLFSAPRFLSQLVFSTFCVASLPLRSVLGRGVVRGRAKGGAGPSKFMEQQKDVRDHTQPLLWCLCVPMSLLCML